MRTVPQEERERHSATMRKYWADPAWKRQTLAARLAAFRDPEYRRRHDLLVDEQVAQLVAQLRAGSSVGQVARDWMVSTTTVYKHAHAHGIDLDELRARRRHARRQRRKAK